MTMKIDDNMIPLFAQHKADYGDKAQQELQQYVTTAARCAFNIGSAICHDYGHKILDRDEEIYSQISVRADKKDDAIIRVSFTSKVIRLWININRRALTAQLDWAISRLKLSERNVKGDTREVEAHIRECIDAVLDAQYAEQQTGNPDQMPLF